MRKINKNNQNGKITRGISAISLAAVATMGLAGCKADEPMVLYGMPDDMMIREELDKAESATSESEAVDINEDKSNDDNVIADCRADEPMDLYGMPDDAMIQEELDKAASETSESEAETDDSIVVDPEK